VADDTNGLADIFVHDRTTGATTRVSVVDSSGAQATGGASSNPSISSDGRFVAFESLATNLVADDTNGLADIFVHDRTTGATTRVSVVDSSGAQATGGASSNPSISPDGRFVAFESLATNLVTGDTNGLGDVFVHDRQTDRTTRVSVASGGAEGNNDSFAPSISSDGDFVAFESDATNLVAGDTNTRRDIFVRDQSGSSLDDGGRAADTGCFIDTASGRIPRSLDGALLLLVAAAAFAAAMRLKTGSK
jgi:tricorn protease-like protein